MPGVAVVAAAPGEQPPPLRAAARAPVLQAHLDRDLDRDRARVGEEDVLQRLRGDLHERGRQPDRGLVGEPAEHHMAHPPELVADGLVEHRMGVAVDGRPPGRHPVDQLAHPVHRLGQPQPHPRRGLHQVRRPHARHGRVRVPDVLPVEVEQLGRGEVTGGHIATMPARAPRGQARRSRGDGRQWIFDCDHLPVIAAGGWDSARIWSVRSGFFLRRSPCPGSSSPARSCRRSSQPRS